MAAFLDRILFNPMSHLYSFAKCILRFIGWCYIMFLDAIGLDNVLGYCYYPVTPEANSPFDIVSNWWQFRKRNDNEFLLTLFKQRGAVADFMTYQLGCTEAKNQKEWLAHTNIIISKFLDRNHNAAKHELNFWGSSYIAQTYQQTGQQALDWTEKVYAERRL